MSIIQISELCSEAKTFKSNYGFWGSKQERFKSNVLPAVSTFWNQSGCTSMKQWQMTNTGPAKPYCSCHVTLCLYTSQIIDSLVTRCCPIFLLMAVHKKFFCLLRCYLPEYIPLCALSYMANLPLFLCLFFFFFFYLNKLISVVQVNPYEQAINTVSQNEAWM